MNLLRKVGMTLQLTIVKVCLLGTLHIVHAQPTRNTNSIQALATITEMNGLVEVRKAQAILWSKASEQIMLYDQDVVRVAEQGYAIIVFPDRSQVLLGPDSLMIQQRASYARNTSRPPLFDAFWRTIRRIRSNEAQYLSEPRDGNWRGRSTLIVPVTPARDSVYHKEPLFAWQPPFYTPDEYKVSLYTIDDGNTCWRGGSLVWEIAVQDTFAWYPTDKPPLTPGSRYRLEIKASPPSKAGLQCFIFMNESARAAIYSKLQPVDNELYSVTKELLRASILGDMGYYSDALTSLQRVLTLDPNNGIALEIRAYVLEQLKNDVQ